MIQIDLNPTEGESAPELFGPLTPSQAHAQRRCAPLRIPAAVLVAVALSGAAASNAGARAACYEDSPCWNWRTMGNHKRGIVTKAGRKLVIGPKRFDSINRAHRIDWARTPHLKGDTP